MQRTVRIPDGEDGVMSVLRITLVDLLVHATEGAIYVLIVVGCDVCVVDGCVEVLEDGRILRLDRDAREDF